MSWLTNRRTRKRFPTKLEVTVLGDTRRPDAVQVLMDERTRLENLKHRVKFYDDILTINGRIDEIDELISMYTTERAKRLNDAMTEQTKYLVTTVDEGEVEIVATSLADAQDKANAEFGVGGWLEILPL